MPSAATERRHSVRGADVLENARPTDRQDPRTFTKERALVIKGASSFEAFKGFEAFEGKVEGEASKPLCAKGLKPPFGLQERRGFEGFEG